MYVPAQTFNYKHTSETELARVVLDFIGEHRVTINPNDTNSFRIVFASGALLSFSSIDEFNAFMLEKGVYSPTAERFRPNAPAVGRINWQVLQTI